MGLYCFLENKYIADFLYPLWQLQSAFIPTLFGFCMNRFSLVFTWQTYQGLHIKKSTLFFCKIFASFTSSELKWIRWFSFFFFVLFCNQVQQHIFALKEDDWQAKTCTKLLYQYYFQKWNESQSSCGWNIIPLDIAFFKRCCDILFKFLKMLCSAFGESCLERKRNKLKRRTVWF